MNKPERDFMTGIPLEGHFVVVTWVPEQKKAVSWTLSRWMKCVGGQSRKQILDQIIARLEPDLTKISSSQRQNATKVRYQ